MRELKTIKRDEALADMRRAVASGSLHIRQMTEDERVRYAPSPRLRNR
jgi:hypothetical protein